eukprot:5577456-Pleurochrysis_carterae.AAC.1
MFSLRAQTACVAVAETDRSSRDQGTRARGNAQINEVLCSADRRFCRNRFARGRGFSYAFSARCG